MSKYRVVAIACAAVALAAGLALPQAAIAADTKVQLPLTGFASMLVDEPHGHIYFTSGTSTVTITDLTGANAVTRSGLGGAVGLAMSPDGRTVYVAARSANEIAAIDTTTLTVTTAVPGLDCPRYLAFADSKLFFSYGCTAGRGNIGSVDFSGPSPAVATSLITDYWYGPPYIAAGAASSGVLAAADADTEPNRIIAYDVSSGAPTKLAQNQTDVCENFEGMAVTSTGARMALACGSPYHVTVFNTADLSTVDTYGSTPYPSGVAISSGDSALAAGFSQSNPNLVVYPFGSPTSPTAQYDLQAGASGFMTTDGMRFGPSGDLYVVVPTSVSPSNYDLFVLHGASLAASTFTLSAPSSAPLGHAVSISGSITSATPLTYPVTLSVTKQDIAGTHTMPAITTDANGQFRFNDTPSAGGPVTYTVAYAGDASHRGGTQSATVNVDRRTTTISLSSDDTRYRYDAPAHLTAHLGPTDTGHVVSIYATPRGEARQLVKRGVA